MEEKPHKPLPLSIVLCTRNRADQLDGALKAISAIKTSHDWECLIVDNGSTDHTHAVIERAMLGCGNIRTIRNDIVGLGASRDAGWREARGDIIALTDDDCYVAADYVDSVIEAFADSPQAGCIGGRILLFDHTDAPVAILERDQPYELPVRQFMVAGMLQGANLCFRRSTLLAIGGFDPALGAGTPFPCEDTDAIAATLWGGISAQFDPRIVVYHHHRRKSADVPALVASYDRGRGAYYAKFLLRPEARWAYAWGWLKSAFGNSNRKRLARELVSAKQYLDAKNRKILALSLVPVGGAIYFVSAITRFLKRRDTGA